MGGWRKRVSGPIVVALFAACGGCSSSAQAEPTYASADPTAQGDFDRARQAFEQGRADQAQGLFSSFIVAHPQDTLRQAAELHLGRIAAGRGQHDEAVTWLELAAASPDDTLARAARRELGASLVQGGQHARAMEVLEPLAEGLEGEAAAAHYETLAAAAQGAGQPERRLGYLDARLPFLGEEARGAAVQQVASIVGALDVAALERVVASLPRSGVAWPLVATRLGGLALEGGQEERVAEILAQLEAAGAGEREEVAALQLALEQTRAVDWSAVGALLPLSGRARLVGEQMRAGLQLAVEGAEGGEALRLVVRDTAAEGADVAQLVQDLVETERVTAIIGPVDSASADVAARRAEELGVPLLALTIRPDVTGAGRWVLRAFQSNEAEVRTLVTHAAGTLGLRRFAILYPNRSYGRVLRGLAEQEVARQGGTIVVTRGYDPTQRAFVQDCQALAEEEFEALIIPDRGATVALIAPALAAAGLWSRGPEGAAGPAGTRPVQLLLPAAGFDVRLVRQAGRYLQGAAFVTPLWPEDDAPAALRFVDAYRAAHSRAPSAYASQAHDAAQVLRAARSVAGRRTREGLLAALLSLTEAPTAGRFEGFEASGEPRAPLHLLTLQGEAFARISR